MSVNLLRHAIDRGVDHIDTAEFHGGGSVNRAIRAALPADGSIVVATEVGGEPDHGPVPVKLAQRPEQSHTSNRTWTSPQSN